MPKLRFCTGDSYCDYALGSSGTCQPKHADGASCTKEFYDTQHDECMTPSICENGKCAFPTTATCG